MGGRASQGEARHAPPASTPLKAAEGGASAPILFFDIAPVFAVRSGVYSLVLETFVQDLAGSNATDTGRIVVAHLRTTAEGIRSLRAVLDKIELIVARPEGGPN